MSLFFPSGRIESETGLQGSFPERRSLRAKLSGQLDASFSLINRITFGSRIQDSCLSKDKQLLLLADEKEGLAIFEATPEQDEALCYLKTQEFPDFVPTICSIALSSDQKTLAIGTTEDLRLYGVSRGDSGISLSERLVQKMPSRVSALAFHPEHASELAVGTAVVETGTMEYARVYILDIAQEPSLLAKVHGGYGQVARVSYAPDGSALTLDQYGATAIFDRGSISQNDKMLSEVYREFGQGGYYGRFGVDANQFVTCSVNGRVNFVDRDDTGSFQLAGHIELKPTEYSNACPEFPVFSPSGKWLALSHAWRDVVVYEQQSVPGVWKEHIRLHCPGVDGAIRNLMFASNDSRLWIVQESGACCANIHSPVA